jgi:transcription initiation factor IIE alpha subunit
MTKKKLPNHLHLYKKIDLVPKWKQTKHNREPYIVFICQKPTCTYRMPLNLAIGKLCECNRCHEPMILDKETVTLTKPHCQNCIVRKAKPELDKLSELLDKI